MFTSKDDLFHPAPVGDWAWTETNWFSFQIPEDNIDGEVYVYFRPNLGVTYAGVFAWDGFVSFWVKNVAFALWIIVMAWALWPAMQWQGRPTEATT